MVSQHQEELQYVQEEYESVLQFFICDLECIFLLFDLKMHDVWIRLEEIIEFTEQTHKEE